MSKLVRIIPRNPQRGYFRERVAVTGSKYPIFTASRGWYEVDDEMAKKLKAMRQNENDPDSKRVFQVATRRQAIALERVEKKQVAKAKDPVRMPKGIENDDSDEAWDEAFSEEDELEEEKEEFLESLTDEEAEAFEEELEKVEEEPVVSKKRRKKSDSKTVKKPAPKKTPAKRRRKASSGA